MNKTYKKNWTKKPPKKDDRHSCLSLLSWNVQPLIIFENVCVEKMDDILRCLF